jgi:hypothetical protein
MGAQMNWQQHLFSCVAVGVGLISLALPASAQPVPDNLKAYNAAALLKNYALANCLQQAAPSQDLGRDAQASAAAYIEFGQVNDADAYLDISKLAGQWLKKNYPSQSGQQLQVMKCIDFHNSPELARKIKRYTQALKK